MQLSVIIVNYNVKYFLEQCLYSVQKALRSIEGEIFVVDNASRDGSIEYLRPRFPSVKFIVNSHNAGFGKANNLAIKEASGDLILFLNPDTIVPEDSFTKCVNFMKNQNKAGACGVRMIDGSGTFLPESKRSFPAPLTSLFKLVGLNALFPRSKVFARYRLGHLDEHQNHTVDVLSGAFMIVRKDILLQLNGFDEAFYMYGEDIDLSFRIQKSGFSNYYFSGSTIIHFKGESTRKGSLNYVRMFYQAMSIFVKKHYSGKNAKLFSLFIHTGIWIRAVFALLSKVFTKTSLLLFDALIIYGSFNLVCILWIRFMREGYGFMAELVNIALPGFTIVFLLAAGLAGIYENKYKPLKALYATLVATIVMLAVYALLPEVYRFSRGVILFGGLAALIFITFFRWLLVYSGIVQVPDDTKNQQPTLIVGSANDVAAAELLLLNAGYDRKYIAHINGYEKYDDESVVVKQLKRLMDSVPLREVIFCEGLFSFSQIIEFIQKIKSNAVIKFHAEGSQSIIGSDSKHSAGESLSAEGSFRLADPYQRRMKRTIDILLSLFILLTSPAQLLFAGFRIIAQAFYVLTGDKTWIGYTVTNDRLPPLPKGVLSVSGQNLRKLKTVSNEDNTLDLWYAKTYDWLHDVKLIVRYYRELGAK